MHQGKLVFAQLMLYLPLSTFRRCVADHRGEHKVKDFSCLDQFFAMAFAQLTYRESLRDIEVNLRAQAHRLYHMGFRCQTVSRNTLANANATRPWQIYADFAQHLIGLARPLYAKEPFGLELDAAVYAFDASTIDLCLSVFAWAPFRTTKAAIKLHTLLDLRGNIPSFIHITDGRTHEVNVMDDLVLEPGAFYLMDRGHLDFSRLFVIHEAQAFCRYVCSRGCFAGASWRSSGRHTVVGRCSSLVSTPNWLMRPHLPNGWHHLVQANGSCMPSARLLALQPCWRTCRAIPTGSPSPTRAKSIWRWHVSCCTSRLLPRPIQRLPTLCGQPSFVLTVVRRW